MNAKEIVRQMTLEEKAGMCSGKNVWFTKPVERLGVPSVMLTDGPHGLRAQRGSGDHLGVFDSEIATCFPTASALACSFDRELAYSVAKTIGEEAQAQNIAVVLGPGNNIKRSPLCGRNFEYFSEDPYLAGEMAASHIQGLQSMGVGASLKHFAVNNQESRRMTADARVDERTLREIYLTGFEKAVKQGKPWTVMCSYNKINGVYSCENPLTLDKILRGEWGFDGYVMTDWGAMDDKILSLKAGLELQMPGGDPKPDQILVDAVKSGELDEAVLDRAVERIIGITMRYAEHRQEGAAFDAREHHAFARKAAGECMVLLKNEESLLPLSGGMKIALIGKMAEAPRYQGGGSSHINPTEVLNALTAFQEYADASYSPGYTLERDEDDERLLMEAVAAAKDANVAVIFAGLPDSFESEGYDRTHINMPNCQNRLIDEICAVQKNVVIVLSNGSPVAMPWLGRVSAVLEGHLAGQAGGGAAADILFGKVNPSAKLAETYPLKLSDNPSYLNFPGDGDEVDYREGLYVGYRYYDKKEMPVLFPFGYGLSFTSFRYDNLRLSDDEIKDADGLTVSIDVTNTGFIAGKEIVQLYVAPAHAGVSRPARELEGFEKVCLEAGETKTVTFALDFRSFAYYEVRIHEWFVEEGPYSIEIGASSRDIRAAKNVTVHATKRIPKIFTINTPLEDVMQNAAGKAFVDQILEGFKAMMGGDGASGGEFLFEMMKSSPLRALMMFSQGALTGEMLEGVVAQMNQIEQNT